MNLIILLGLPLLAGGILLIMFVTVPSFQNIINTPETLSNAQTQQQTIKSVGTAVVSGIVLYLTTGLFIMMLVGGVLCIIAGIAD